MKIISPKLHAILDYLTVAFLIAAPSLFPALSEHAKILAYALGAVHLILTLLTAFSGGLLKVIPLRIHGIIEFFVSLILGFLAFTYFSHSMTDHFFYASLAAVILVVFILTDYKGKID